MKKEDNTVDIDQARNILKLRELGLLTEEGILAPHAAAAVALFRQITTIVFVMPALAAIATTITLAFGAVSVLAAWAWLF